MEDAMKEIYCYEPIQNKNGEFKGPFIDKLPETIEETYPIKKDFREKTEKLTLLIRHSEGQIAATLLRCRVDKWTIFGNQMIIAYRNNEGLQCYKIFQRYLLQGREADITIGRVHEFIMIDNLLFIREILNPTINVDLTKAER